MAIEEKPQILEFIWTYKSEDGSSDLSFEIIYDEQTNNAYKLLISNQNMNQNLQCPVEMLSEVVDYLKSKGVIKQASYQQPPVSGAIPRTSAPNGGLPVPSIQKKQNKKEDQKEVVIPSESYSAIPIASFDVPTSQVVLNNVPSLPPQKTAEGKVVVSADTASEIPQRPVIRTKSDDGAESEAFAAEERRKMGRGKSVIRKISPVEE